MSTYCPYIFVETKVHIHYKTIMESKKLGEGMLVKVDVKKLSAERVNSNNISCNFYYISCIKDIRNYQALGAVDHTIDLTVGVEEWSLLANSFTNFPPVPNLTKSTTIMPILLKAKLGKNEID